ncbi:carbon-nitrogen hydrolase family protein [Bombilactobacillus bombi]|uniref:carbon-nitrogen hydrolase family protein n=1 Tax=Bombilactobacillus bombi TaxID=1303590 RepID=UPI000E591FEA|nr:carbon-nitrogen hydrolase family protein [Bombilactobacillus bombi]AXX64474.1 carbon-nitrogen hydrolase family protein [Bombilactobacillus bombi]
MRNLHYSLPTGNLRVALAQMQSIDGDIQRNVERAVEMIEQAAEKKTKLIVFPEKYLTGYVPELIAADKEKYTLSDNDERLLPLYAACKKNHIIAIVGAPTRANGNIYISSIVISSKGEEKIRYHKMTLFQSEKKLYTGDINMVILSLGDWKLGLGICYDAGFSEHARLLAQAGCHAYLVSSLFSKGNGYNEAKIWFPARALDNTMFVTMTNYVGKTGDWQTCGASGIWNPMGHLIAGASETEPNLIIADLCPNDIKEARLGEQMLSDSSYYHVSGFKIVTVEME